MCFYLLSLKTRTPSILSQMSQESIKVLRGWELGYWNKKLPNPARFLCDKYRWYSQEIGKLSPTGFISHRLDWQGPRKYKKRLSVWGATEATEEWGGRLVVCGKLQRPPLLKVLVKVQKATSTSKYSHPLLLTATFSCPGAIPRNEVLVLNKIAESMYYDINSARRYHSCIYALQQK